MKLYYGTLSLLLVVLLVCCCSVKASSAGVTSHLRKKAQNDNDHAERNLWLRANNLNDESTEDFMMPPVPPDTMTNGMMCYEFGSPPIQWDSFHGHHEGLLAEYQKLPAPNDDESAEVIGSYHTLGTHIRKVYRDVCSLDAEAATNELQSASDAVTKMSHNSKEAVKTIQNDLNTLGHLLEELNPMTVKHLETLEGPKPMCSEFGVLGIGGRFETLYHSLMQMIVSLDEESVPKDYYNLGLFGSWTNDTEDPVGVAATNTTTTPDDIKNQEPINEDTTTPDGTTTDEDTEEPVDDTATPDDTNTDEDIEEPPIEKHHLAGLKALLVKEVRGVYKTICSLNKHAAKEQIQHAKRLVRDESKNIELTEEEQDALIDISYILKEAGTSLDHFGPEEMMVGHSVTYEDELGWKQFGPDGWGLEKEEEEERIQKNTEIAQALLDAGLDDKIVENVLISLQTVDENHAIDVNNNEKGDMLKDEEGLRA